MRKITFELKVIEVTSNAVQSGNIETVIFTHKPTIPATNSQHLYNLMLIAIELVRNKFRKKEL